MANVYVILVIVFASSVVLGQVNEQISSIGDGQVVLSAELRVLKQKELQYALAIKNNSLNTVYYSANPQQVCGEHGPYISLDSEDSSIVNFQWRIFDPDIVLQLDCTTNDARVELKRLEPGKTVQDLVLVKWPLSQTAPPFRGKPFQKLERRNVKRIRFTVGYFDEEEGILDYLKRKRFGWFINGTEAFEKGALKGNWFYKGQKLASVEVTIPETK